MSPYFDYASTTPLHPAALEALSRTSAELFADPSRLYGAARRARMALDSARDSVARAVGGHAEEIVFTSGGTESCNLAISSGARAASASRRPLRVLVSAVEHTAVLEPARALQAGGFEVVEIGVDRYGGVDLDMLERECRAGAGLVSLQVANNEVGTLQPVEEAARLARAAGALVHADACAAVGHIEVNVARLGVDLLSGSSHKFYGPKGAGFLWVRRGVRIRPVIAGDDRERGRRAGLENLPAVAGMAAALEARLQEIEPEGRRLRRLTERLRAELPRRIPDCEVHGDPERRLPGLVAFSLLYLEGEALLLGLDQAGFAVHSGSACTSARQEPSHVLAAMAALTQGSVRVSLGRHSSGAEVDAFLEALPPLVERARRLAGTGS